MERVIERRQDLKKALKNLHDSIQLFNESKNKDHAFYIQIMVNRDAVIKRFELCYDLLWKCLKDFLEQKFGVLVNSPKKVFQEARIQNLLTSEELAEALALVDDRNLTTHTYDDEFAEKVAERVIAHFELMRKITEKIRFNS